MGTIRPERRGVRDQEALSEAKLYCNEASSRKGARFVVCVLALAPAGYADMARNDVTGAAKPTPMAVRSSVLQLRTYRETANAG